MIAAIVITGALAFAVAYTTYGKSLMRLFGLADLKTTPAHALRDDADYCPAKRPVLFGHHFSSIAGAGPIVGPIFATVLFGWLPTVLWIIIGSILVGGVHDLGALAISIRHRAQSIAQAAREQLSPLASKLLLAFVWLTLVYVLVVFLDLTAATFAPTIPAGMHEEQAHALMLRGGGVATSSIWFVTLALALGAILRYRPQFLGRASFAFVPLVLFGVYAGQLLPLTADALPQISSSPGGTWRILLLAYCYVASIAPVWLLLQPRDYLSSFLLFACLGGGVLGISASALSSDPALAASYPAFVSTSGNLIGSMFPALFITVACGACSGFHSIVASGTTAKQLDTAKDARAVGYGSMLLEGLLALIAVATVIVLTPGTPETKMPPPIVFATGLARFTALLGLPVAIGQSFAMLSLSTFLLTTLDTCTRLARYTLGELCGLKGRASAQILTLITLAVPFALVSATFVDAQGHAIPAWKVVWPVFGATNQLLAGLALLVVTLWLRNSGKSVWATLPPMVLILSATLVALTQLVITFGFSLVGIIATLLLCLAIVLLVESLRGVLRLRRQNKPNQPALSGP